MIKQNYTKEQVMAYLIWCLTELFEQSEGVIKTHPNNKPLSTLTNEEFAVENLDQTLAVVAGQLDDMGIDYEVLLTKTNEKNYSIMELYDIVFPANQS